MHHLTKYVFLPLLAPIAIVGLYFTPRDVFGCANRGYLALAVVLIALFVALGNTVKAITEMRRQNQTAPWWIISALILLLPALLVLGPLG